MTKIGLVQARSCPDIRTNLQTLDRLTREAGDLGCAVVCFPECFLTGYLPEQARVLAVSREDPVMGCLSEMARVRGMDLMVGFMESTGDSLYITQGLFRRDGSRAYYRKTHLGQREAGVFAPGDSLEVFSLSCGWKIGFQICVETHFPEITQTLALKGAEAIFAPHAVPRVAGDREKVWGKYIPARSYDNRVYMLCCNLWDEDRFAGGCLVTDPKGEITASSFAPGEHLVVATLDRNLTAEYRGGENRPVARFFPARRRPELYRLS